MLDKISLHYPIYILISSKTVNFSDAFRKTLQLLIHQRLCNGCTASQQLNQC